MQPIPGAFMGHDQKVKGSNDRVRMDGFRAAMRESRKGPNDKPWHGMRAVAKSMFGSSIFYHDKKEDRLRMQLNRAQMDRLANNPQDIEAHLRRLRDNGTLPEDFSVQEAVKRFSSAAKDAINGNSSITGNISQNGSLRMATYNIKHASLSDLKAIAADIKRTKPDVIGLEEMVEGQAKTLGKLTGMNFKFEAAFTKKNGVSFGNAILSPHPIKDVKKVQLPNFPGHEPRILLKAKVKLDGEYQKVGVTHLSHLGEHERVVQTRAMLKHLDGDEILLGDFNFRPGSDAYKILTRHYDDAFVAAGERRRRGVDYVFMPESGWMTVNTSVKSSNGNSDHPIISADVVRAPFGTAGFTSGRRHSSNLAQVVYPRAHV
jgi:endonuclease/exonuclease/phosphatase family metal-dependent hydrolase